MRTNIDIDDGLMRQAIRHSGVRTKKAAVEAGLASGTFSTADAALEAGREVLVVPGSIFAPECRGPNRLLRQGATPITDVSELADALSSLVGAHSESPVGGSDLGVNTSDALLRALLADPMRPDDAARTLGLDIVEVARRIGRLESEMLVARYPDGRYGPR